MGYEMLVGLEMANGSRCREVSTRHLEGTVGSTAILSVYEVAA